MYYEEKVINGETFWRSNPAGEWIKCTNSQLTRSIENLKEQLKANNEGVDLRSVKEFHDRGNV